MRIAIIALIVWFICHMIFMDYLEYHKVMSETVQTEARYEQENARLKLLLDEMHESQQIQF